MRSYVLAPYQMVKDLRTDYEVGNPAAVFDGDLDGFIAAGIRWRKRPDRRLIPDASSRCARSATGAVRFAPSAVEGGAADAAGMGVVQDARSGRA